ncbi:hypothetical protein NEOKW01_0720 [Nematocida sp. AWRm80]|nr:hypothetical protein NEOKW01_0720 [Nematocida sp. AWRm80]
MRATLLLVLLLITTVSSTILAPVYDRRSLRSNSFENNYDCRSINSSELEEIDLNGSLLSILSMHPINIGRITKTRTPLYWTVGFIMMIVSILLILIVAIVFKPILINSPVNRVFSDLLNFK